MTPLSLNIPRYSTRRNSVGLLNFIHEPGQVYRRRLNRLASRRILENLGSESISDIHSLFVENNNCLSDIMGEYFSPLNISQIAGQPHNLPDKAVDNQPMFTGIDAINASLHLKNFSICISAYISDPTHKHEDVYMKLFSLFLDGDVGECSFESCKSCEGVV